MSWEAVSWAVKKLLPITQKMVLVMLANRVNPDTGKCVPRIRTLAEDCGIKETAVRSAIKELVDKNLMTVHERKVEGVNLSNQYELHLWSSEHDRPMDPDSPFNPLRQTKGGVPRQTNHPPLRQTKGGGSADEGGTSPNEGIETKRETEKETNTSAARSKSLEDKSTTKSKQPGTSLPDWVDKQAWADWLDMRKANKWPLTERATTIALNKLNELRAKGYDPKDVLEEAVLRNWRGIFEPKGVPQAAHAGGNGAGVRDDDPNAWGMTTAAQRAAEAGMPAWNNVEASMGRMPDFDTYKRFIHSRLTQRHAA